MKLRGYQQECREKVAAEFEERSSTLVVMPTGCGKTILFAAVIADALAQGRRALVIAHREELIRQAAAKIKAVTGIDPDIEMADFRAFRGFYKAQIVVGTVQTLGLRDAKRMDGLGEFGLLIIDECHHGTARTYRKVIETVRAVNPYAKVLGVTATPDRSDEEALGQIFESVAFDMNVADAIQDGWLVNVKQKYIQCEHLDLSKVRTRAGDLAQDELDAVLERDSVVQEMVDPLFQEAGDRRTLVFCSSCAQSDHAVEILNAKRHNCAATVNGETPPIERQAIFSAFGRGEIQYLVNVGIATEGWDDPCEDGRGVQVVAMMRPTKSRALYAQCIGRGTRAVPAVNNVLGDLPDSDARRRAIASSAKPCVTVFDFVGNAGRHHLIHAADVLGGKFSEQVLDEVRSEHIDDVEGEEFDVLATLSEAQIKADEEEERERQRKFAPVRSAVSSKYRVEDIDPFAFVGITTRRVPIWLQKPMTQKQADFLKKNNVPNYLRLNLGEASQVIDKLMSQPSPKQAWFLRQHGRDPTRFDRISASAEIDKVKNGGV